MILGRFLSISRTAGVFLVSALVCAIAYPSARLGAGRATREECFDVFDDIGMQRIAYSGSTTHQAWWVLVQKAQNGDGGALDSFLAAVTDQFWPIIYRQFDPDVHRAQDVMNEVLLRTAQKIPEMTDEDIPALVSLIVRGRVLDARRRVRNQVSLSDSSPAVTRKLLAMEDDRPTPDAQQILDEDIVKLQQALRLLDPRTRYVITRHEGLDGKPPATLKEIGEEPAFSVTGKRIQQIHARGMHQLKSYMKALQSMSLVELIGKLKSAERENQFEPKTAREPQWKPPGLKGVLSSIRYKVSYEHGFTMSENAVEAEFLRELKNLAPQEKQILTGVYVDGKSLADIAAAAGLSVQETGNMGRTALDDLKKKVVSAVRQPATLKDVARARPKNVAPLSPQQEKERWEDALGRFFGTQGLTSSLEQRISELKQQELETGRSKASYSEWLTIILNPSADKWSASQVVGRYLDKRAPNIAWYLNTSGQAPFSAPITGGFTGWLRTLAQKPEVQMLDLGNGEASTVLERLDVGTRKWFLESASNVEKLQPAWLRVSFRTGVEPLEQLRKNLGAAIEGLDIEVDPHPQSNPQTLRVRATAAGALAILMRPNLMALTLDERK